MSKQQDILQQNIIKVLGLEALPDERKLALLDKMTDLVQKRVSLKILEQLQENDKQELEQIMKKGSPEKLGAFLSKKVPNLEELLKQEITTLKQEMKNRVKGL